MELRPLADAAERDKGPDTAPAGALPADQYEAIVQFSSDAILSKDREGLITSWNPAAARIYGYAPDEAIGRPISILIPEHRAGEERRILEQVLAGKNIDHYETERVTKDGRMLSVSLSVSPIREETGGIVGASVVARDVTERERSIELASRLQALSSALSKEITPERTVDVLLEHAVAGLGADAGTVGLLNDSRTEVELAGNVGHSEEGLSVWKRFPLDAELPMSVAIRSGEPVWTTSADELRSRFPALRGASVRFASLAVIPLVVEGTPFGALALSFAAQRRFDSEERAFLLAMAQQAAQTLDRAWLYEARRVAGERLAYLAEASELLAGSLDPDDSLRRLADLAVHRFADWCGIELVDEDGGLRSVAVAHVDPRRVALAEELRARYPVDPEAETGVPRVIRTGEPELYHEIDDPMLADAARDQDHLRMLRELGMVSAMIVPLRARGRSLGAVTFVAAESERRFDRADLELATDLARRAGLAIDNAMLFRREHEAAVILQRSLLPQSLPRLEGVEFAVRYEPASPGLQVGGDWYEVVAREDGQVGLVIGDVAGRGIKPASVMGRVRPALRAYIADGLAPCDAVERLDELLKESERPEMTTVFLLTLDPVSGSAEYVRAGHPPALLRLPDGRVQELAGRGTPPVGIFERLECRSHSIEVPPGSLLLLYTDGLIERRGESVEDGLKRLKRLFGRGPADPECCLQSLASDLGTDGTPDDVAMLAMATGPRSA
jgi:PAS domain S-box-containing protein